MEVQEKASVAELKEVVASQQGVRPELLRVLFAGRELKSTSTLQVSSDRRGEKESEQGPHLFSAPASYYQLTCSHGGSATVHMCPAASMFGFACLFLHF